MIALIKQAELTHRDRHHYSLAQLAWINQEIEFLSCIYINQLVVCAKSHNHIYVKLSLESVFLEDY